MNRNKSLLQYNSVLCASDSRSFFKIVFHFVSNYKNSIADEFGFETETKNKVFITKKLK